MASRSSGGEEIFPAALAMARMFGGALFFQLVVRLSSAQKLPIARADHVRLAWLSVLGIAANQTLYLLGLRWTTPFAVALLGATIPVFTAALAVVFGKEKASWRSAIGIAVALSGVGWLVGAGSLDAGAVLVALNSLSYAAYVVLSRDVVLRVGALRTVAWLFTYGALLFAPIGVLPLVEQVPVLTARGWGLLAYILVMPTIVAYLLNAWALGRSSPTLVTVYIYLQPIIAAVLARVQLGHTISSRVGVAALFILVGVGVVASRRRTPSTGSPPASPGSPGQERA